MAALPALKTSLPQSPGPITLQHQVLRDMKHGCFNQHTLVIAEMDPEGKTPCVFGTSVSVPMTSRSLHQREVWNGVGLRPVREPLIK